MGHEEHSILDSVIVGAVLTCVCYFLIQYPAVGSGASGHAGAGMVAMFVFFPLPFILAMLSSTTPDNAFASSAILLLARVGMILQFPLYGFIASYARLKRTRWLKLCAWIVWLHLLPIGLLTQLF